MEKIERFTDEQVDALAAITDEYDINGEKITMTPEEQALLIKLHEKVFDAAMQESKHHRKEICPYMPKIIAEGQFIINNMINAIITSLLSNPTCKPQLVALKQCYLISSSCIGILSDLFNSKRDRGNADLLSYLDKIVNDVNYDGEKNVH